MTTKSVLFRSMEELGAGGSTSIILATQETEIRIIVQDPISKMSNTKQGWLVEWLKK
jgi:hypothetical protein